MSMKPIAVFAATIAVFATLATAQAGPTTPVNELVNVSQAGSFQVAWNWPQPPRQPTAAVAAVRG
jgi:ABC-type molybdate transport system substrate-binding protein